MKEAFPVYFMHRSAQRNLLLTQRMPRAAGGDTRPYSIDVEKEIIEW